MMSDFGQKVTASVSARLGNYQLQLIEKDIEIQELREQITQLTAESIMLKGKDDNKKSDTE